MPYNAVHVSRTIVGLVGVALIGAESLQLRATATAVPLQAASPQRALVETYCVGCHNERLKTANLLLDKMDLDHVGADQEAWAKIVRKLRAGTMPPIGRPRPDQATVDSFIAGLETALDHAAAVHPNPGRPTIHRLNRTEYANAIRDLLSLGIEARSLL